MFCICMEIEEINIGSMSYLCMCVCVCVCVCSFLKNGEGVEKNRLAFATKQISVLRDDQFVIP